MSDMSLLSPHLMVWSFHKEPHPVEGVLSIQEFPHKTLEVLCIFGQTVLTHSFRIMPQCPIETCIGTFSENTPKFQKEFLRLTQAYYLTWSDITIS
jgi:hypothetical protein